MSNEQPENKESCYNCQNYRICHLRRLVDEAIKSNTHIIDVDRTKKRASFTEVYTPLAACCLEFKPNDEGA